MSDLEIGLIAVVALAMVIVAFVLGRRSGSSKTTVAVATAASSTQVAAETQAQKAVDEARIIKAQAVDAAIKERDAAVAAQKTELSCGSLALEADGTRLNVYLKQVGDDVRKY